MKIKFFLAFCLAVFSLSVFPQSNDFSNQSKISSDLILKKVRTERIKADILQEIQTLKSKDQAYFYTLFGNYIWKHDQKEGLFWIKKGVELGLSPATEYKDDLDKLSSLSRLFSEKDDFLFDKILSKIKEIKIDYSDSELSKEANKIFIGIAEDIFRRKKYEESAFEFAVFSLKGSSPAVTWTSSEFFRGLKSKNESLANAYFSELLKTVKSVNDEDLFHIFVYYFADEPISNYPVKDERFRISDAQRKGILELLLPSIQKDFFELSQNDKNSCGLINIWGLKFQEDYKRLLPEKSPFIEQAINLCQIAQIESWKKPEFYKKPRKTGQDFLNLADEITDKKIRATYLFNASQFARKEKNYPLAIDTLNKIEAGLLPESSIKSLKIQIISDSIEDLVRKGDFAEARKLYSNYSQEIRPFAVAFSLYTIWRLEPQNKGILLDLLNQARADFNKIDKFALPTDYSNSPTRFGSLTQFYVKFGFYEEAIAVHGESIKLLNRYTSTLPSEYKDKPIFRASSYSDFTNQAPPKDVDFINQYFDRIYENIGEIENSEIRLYERLNFLRKNLEGVNSGKLIQ